MAKAWCTDMGVEVTSLAIQIWGGMGFIEESGVPQHYRDARITTIYEGTNGIQAMDLVGRKLGLRGGTAVLELFDTMAAIDAELAAGGSELAEIRSALADALATVRTSVEWTMTNGLADPRDALAGATPLLRMFSLAVAGWLMARQALAAVSIGGDEGAAKLSTASFFCTQWLPQVHGLTAQVSAGAGALMDLSAEQLASH